MQIKHRKNGASAGSSDVYYRSPGGKRYRSRKEIVLDMSLTPLEDLKHVKPAADQAAAAKALVAKSKLKLPLSLAYGVTVVRCALCFATDICFCRRKLVFGADRSRAVRCALLPVSIISQHTFTQQCCHWIPATCMEDCTVACF